jgi:hypothetical protein
MINDFFGGAVCINLPERKDRKEHATKEFERLGLTASFIEGINGKKCGLKPNAPPNRNFTQINQGELGCVLSHQKAIQYAKDRGWDSVLVMEDDVEFGDKDEIVKYLDSVPKNWDIIYIGGNNRAPLQPIDQLVGKCRYTLTGHAVIFRSNLYDTLITLLEQKNLINDIIYANLHPIYNAYCPLKNLAWQMESYSDLNGRVVNYDFLKNG